MTFQANIPQSTDLISISQNDILQNFQALNTSWDVNHEGFNDPDAGKHTFVEMPNQASDPAGAATEMTLFSKLASGNSEIHYKRDSSANSFQLSGPIDPGNSTDVNTQTTNYATFLPGGLVYQFGYKDNPTDSGPDGNRIPFHTSFPSQVLSIQLTAVRGTNTERSMYVLNGSVSLSQFRITTSSNSFNRVYYVAIGI